MTILGDVDAWRRVDLSLCREHGGGEFTERVAHPGIGRTRQCYQREKGKLELKAKGMAYANALGREQTECLQEAEKGLLWLGQSFIQGMSYVLVVALPVPARLPVLPPLILVGRGMAWRHVMDFFFNCSKIYIIQS